LKQRRLHTAEAALQERVKELTCLYGISQATQRPDLSDDEMLRAIVELLPPAWQYPEITVARITLDGRSHATSGFHETPLKQTAAVVIEGRKRGTVEVFYVQDRPVLEEGPFLREERSLIDAVARQVAVVVERRQAERDKAVLQEQLRHADRLATIGMLAAGVAHELNEPLGNILGFAQLAAKCAEVPSAAQGDIAKIEAASLHAREIIRKLLTFARQTSARTGRVNLNEIVEEGLFFFEARCAKEGVELVRSLAPDLPYISADPSQLNQVLINLVVNALQAMRQGGTLTVATSSRDGSVVLTVEDTGEGMTEETVGKIFIPFYTTKDVGQGTGLGLPVVHGIVTSHGGSVNVESTPGQGSRFEVILPLNRA
jgi:signal transduction histidine kinase